MPSPGAGADGGIGGARPGVSAGMGRVQGSQ